VWAVREKYKKFSSDKEHVKQPTANSAGGILRLIFIYRQSRRQRIAQTADRKPICTRDGR